VDVTNKSIAAAEVYQPLNDSWAPVSPMSNARSYSTATLLDPAACHGASPPAGYPCGQVLVAAGTGAGGAVLTSAEIYSPASDSWTAVASMARGRSAPSATLRDDGSVLVAGGYGGGPTSETYAPEIQSWVTSAMSTGREAPVAVGLSGRGVLVTGYEGAGVTEIYNSNGTWEPPTASMTTARDAFALAPLPGGRVLAAGGGHYGPQLASAEIWEPSPPPPPAPSVEAVSPSAGPVTSGGNTETITGTNLFPAISLTFGGAEAAAGITFNSDTRITVLAPPHAEGPADVVVGTPARDGGGGGSNSLRVTYVPPPKPAVRSLSPTQGPAGGGTRVTIHGTGFFFPPGAPPPGQAVRFDGVAAAGVVADSDTQITVTAPRHPQPGAIDITVTTPGGTSDVSPADRFSYYLGQGAWVDTSPLREARSHFTSTLLDPSFCRTGSPPAGYPCGKVLATGGVGDPHPSAPLATTELYSPAAGSWAAAPPMDHPRYGHTATLLDGPRCRTATPDAYCGQVLVVGGTLNEDTAAKLTTELYDPIKDRWREVARSSRILIDHSATLLDGPPCQVIEAPSYCGKVLVAGGNGAQGGYYFVTAFTELYDPTAGLVGSWRGQGEGDCANPAADCAGNLHTARAMHTSTALLSGRVLITAGYTTNGQGEVIIGSAEVYDPLTGAWTETAAPLAVRRVDHTATLLEGPACAASSAPSFCGKVLVSGGNINLPRNHERGVVTPTDAVELFDPMAENGAGAFSATGSLRVARGGHSATLMSDGKVLVAGGGGTKFDVFDFTPIASAEVYDPGYDPAPRWSSVDPMHAAHTLHTGTLLDGPACRAGFPPSYCGTVLVAGGGSGTTGPGAFAVTPRIADSEAFIEPPTVSGLSPSGGARAGGTTLSIHGTGFTRDVMVSFGDTQSTAVTVDSRTQITAVVPPRPTSGVVGVAVENLGGPSVMAPANPVAQFAYSDCGVAPAPGQPAYPAGYSLVGLPQGTAVPSQSLLYGWFDQGGGNSYTSQSPDDSAHPVLGGHGYWAWFGCPLSFSPAQGTAATPMSLPLAAYHASMVGNPTSTGPVTVSGHDFAASWDPALNGGVGGYTISGYREAQGLAVGQGTWVFSYVDTAVMLG